MAKSHPALSDERNIPRANQWARNTVASFALLASLVSLSIILHNHYAGSRFAIALTRGISAMDLTRLVPPAEEEALPVAVEFIADEYRALGEYLARRYRVSSEVATNIVVKAHTAGAELKLDPLVILAVISIESRFNPIAESIRGAKGLMQIIPRYHAEKFDPLGGEKAAFDPEANILVGARILKEYIGRTGDLGGALQMYVGASSESGEEGYSAKVMAERDRLHSVLRQSQKQNRTRQQRANKPQAPTI